MCHTIEIFTELEIDPSIPELILKSVSQVLNSHKMEHSCHIDIYITSNDEIRQLNREYRDKDYVTDVLSFPLCEFCNGDFLDDLTACLCPDTNKLTLGDMVISHDKVIEQAYEYGHSVEREFAFLSVHSALHLIGYDHTGSEADTLLMQKHEKENLKTLGIFRC